MAKLTDFINPEHDGFVYLPDEGKLYRIEEVNHVDGNPANISWNHAYPVNAHKR